MDKRYIVLFKDLAQATANMAEQVMNYNNNEKDEHSVETAKTMRDDFQSIVEAITAAGDNYVLSKADSARLLIGAMIQMKQLQSRIDGLNVALNGYQKDIVPKLQDIVDNAEDEEMVHQMAQEKFVIIENNK